MPLRLIVWLRWVALAAIIIAIILIIIRRRLPPVRPAQSGQTKPLSDIWARWRQARDEGRRYVAALSCLKGRTVLIVDPEEKSSRILTWRFQKLGCRVYRARTGAQALNRASELKPDVVVADALLADVSASDFYFGLPDGVSAVVFIGVLQTNWQQVRALGDNIACLARPFDPDEVALAAGSILQRSRSC